MKSGFLKHLGGFMAFTAFLALWGFPVTHAQSTTSTTSGTTTSTSTLQAQITANNEEISGLDQQIATYQAELTQVGANKKTLQAAINALNIQKNEVQTQVAATQKEINVTQLQIQEIGGEITNTQQTITTDQATLAEYIRLLQKADNKSLIEQMLSAGSLVEAWSDLNATLQMQEGVQNEMQTLQSQETDLATSQNASKQEQTTLTNQQQSLTTQQQALLTTEQSKNQLLAETNAQESTYEKLLAQAQAELNSFSAFAQNAGGSKLLANQTNCDAWGCYYNQRDAAWGNDSLNGTKYNLASDGCLVTAMAMVMTHYGYKDVTPVTINSDPGNFAAYYPAYLLITINVDGVSATRKTASIDATLATGNPVIVGLNAYGGTHYVVFVSGSKGNYIMRDPYIANGDDISFSANYSMKDIFGVTKVIVS